MMKITRSLSLIVLTCSATLLIAEETKPTPAAGAGTGGETILSAPRAPADIYDKVGKTLLYRVTGAVGKNVWGTDTYPDFSELAPSAVHAGAVKVDETAVIRITVVKPPAEHPASTRNGVTSQAWGSHDGASYKIERTDLTVPAASPAAAK